MIPRKEATQMMRYIRQHGVYCRRIGTGKYNYVELQRTSDMAEILADHFMDQGYKLNEFLTDQHYICLDK